MNVLFYINWEESSAVGYVRTEQWGLTCILVKDAQNSRYARGTLPSISSMYSLRFAVRLLFALYAGLHVRLDSLSPKWHTITMCTQCPPGKACVREAAVSEYKCFCKPWTYFSYETGSC